MCLIISLKSGCVFLDWSIRYTNIIYAEYKILTVLGSYNVQTFKQNHKIYHMYKLKNVFQMSINFVSYVVKFVYEYI